MASFQVSGSTPGGGPVIGPGAAGTPCSLRHCASEPCPVGATSDFSVVGCSAGGFDEHSGQDARGGDACGQQ